MLATPRETINIYKMKHKTININQRIEINYQNLTSSYIRASPLNKPKETSSP